LTVPALDEVSATYGLLAESVSHPDDFSSVTYRLRSQAKFHDSAPVTPEDVMPRNGHSWPASHCGQVSCTRALVPE
jgi:ABC-type oligopeptide transport system substrate-binding subunit